MGRRAQLQLQFPVPATWGGRRARAGRKSLSSRPEKRHAARPAHDIRFPILVTIRARPKLPSLRGLPTFDAFSVALGRANRVDFRVNHFSVQTDHVHLIVEASSREALIRGLQGLFGRTARALNRHWQRIGKVWNARYHSRALATPREVRNGLVYVLLNFRKHLRVSTGTDPRSSAPWFDGWSSLPAQCAAPCPVARPKTWLGATGWKRAGGLIGLREGPAGSARGHRPHARSRA